MLLLLLSCCGLPLAAALALRVWGGLGERVVSRVGLVATSASALAALAAVGLWLLHGAHPFTSLPVALLTRGDYRLTFALRLDTAAAAFLLLVQFTTGTVIRFSRFYLHREPGFQRFFATALMFHGAMCVLALAGNLQVLFVSWEIVGLASFLLIGFYRERQSAVRNALKTYSVYRVADIGLLLAACLEAHAGSAVMGLLLLLAAIGKSAQFPFCFWVPRAMEGPTPSSALFYGGLSVHAGAYLLVRTEPLWGEAPLVHVAVGVVGLLTAILCAMFSRVQATIKAQIGYASVSQVGLVFVEIALGFPRLALVHLVTNALLRCFQLLVSPSAVAYVLRRHASAGAPVASEERSRYGQFSRKVRATLYTFAMQEGYLKELSRAALWAPLRRVGHAALARRGAVATAALALGSAAVLLAPAASPRQRLALGTITLLSALTMSGCALVAWRTPRGSIAWLTGSNVAIVAAAFAAAPRQAREASLGAVGMMLLSSGLAFAGATLALPRGATISRYAGLVDSHRAAATCALTGALGIAGIPIVPTFLGEDLLLHATLEVSLVFSVLAAAMLASNGYLAVRWFALAFLGAPAAPFTRPTSDGPRRESAR